MGATILDREKIKKELLEFVIITFAATFIFEFGIVMVVDSISIKSWNIIAQVAMFIPAISAIFCMAYFKSESLTKESKIVFGFFLLFVAIFICESVFQPIVDIYIVSVFPLVSGIIAVIGILTVFTLNLKRKWREGLELSKLSFGKNLRNYIIIPSLLVAVLTLGYILNYILGLGLPTEEFNLYLFLTSLIPALIIGLLVTWPSFFGEEYGWRVYLQDRLFPLLGGYKGVLILGIIWGLWHTPLILFGLVYHGQPIIGIGLMVLSDIAIGVVFSYAVLKTGSVWIAVILHLIMDVEGPVNAFITTTPDPIFSFGAGIYGTALMAVFALILLKSNVWKIDKIPEKIGTEW